MINEKTIHLLELNKILNRVAAHTSFSGGADLARELLPSTNLNEARIWQQETTEVRTMLDEGVNIALGGVHDVRDVAIAAQRGVVIEASVLLDIRYTLRRATTLKRTLGRMKGTFPMMAELVVDVEECNDLQQSIERSIDDNAEVKDTASVKLATIRRDMKIAFDKLQTKLNRMISADSNKPYLQETLITMRNGRYVIPIKADHKGKIKGIVHDSSSSGATLFIEPLETVEMNNQWRELQIEEEKEIWRILSALTEMVGDEAEHIVRTVDVLATLDLVRARALYAEEIHAVEPKLVEFEPRKANPNHPGSTIFLKSARHPLLSGNIVPIDVEYDEDTWALVVTGPNTGGKTVSLKTVGLLILMAQCGLHVPAEAARLTVFEGIFADIGDEQSIEQSLSTFSSHMTNTINILRECDERSLVILDELGAGTDPAEGSALARALLNHLVQRRVTVMVSTHHPELKIYSVETLGVRNASVQFDLETLRPTYKLIIGLPGRSNALAIAQRLGLDDFIIADARTMVATEDLVADDLLDEINRTRDDLRHQHDDAEALRQELQDKSDDLQARLDKIEDERRDIINAARRNAEEELKDFQQQIKRLRRDLQTAGMPLETLKAVQEAAQKLMDWTHEPVESVTERPIDELDWIPRLGDTVYLDTLNAEGIISEMDEKEAVVQVGTLRVRAGFNEIRRRNRSQKREMKRGHVRKYDSTEAVVPKGESPGLEIDLRGKRVEDAINQLDVYIDAAYTSGLPFSRIIHGKGTGALRQAVREYLSKHPLVSKVTEGHPNEGGAGVTVIHMVPTV